MRAQRHSYDLAEVFEQIFSAAPWPMLMLGEDGEVLGATPSGGGGLSGTVISCVVSRVSSAQFSPPDGGGATVVIPISFQPQ